MLNQTKAVIVSRLTEFASPLEGMEGAKLTFYQWYLEREKIIYNTLNMFKAEESWFKGVCWCQVKNRGKVDQEINELRQKKKVMCTYLKEVLDHGLTPPTSFPTNDFFKPFQEIVYTYGVPSYREANPTLFTIVTFPFLFGIMFGDLAHGLVLLSISIYICLKKDELVKSKSMLADATEHRYLLLMMGFFSAFCGFMYNDFAAVPIYISNSCYHANPLSPLDMVRNSESCVYPLGVDPIWYASSNELQFVNSFKMKFAVIVGVSHMLIGVVLKGLNAIHYGQPIDFWFEFVPQFIFLLAFFGYMNLMIIIKWVTDWSWVHQNAPSIITLLIGIPLRGSEPGPVPLYGNGEAQRQIGQLVLRTIQ